MRPERKAELADWVRHQLGAPVIRTSELDSTQLEDAIEHAIDYFTEFVGGHGHEETYCVVQTKTCEELKALNFTVTPISGTPFSFCDDKRLASPFMTYKQEYQLPKSVVAVRGITPQNNTDNNNGTWLTTAPNQDIITRGLSMAEGWSNNMAGGFLGGSINSSISNAAGLFFPGVSYSGGQYGTKGGVRGSGWGADIITYELGMQYMEMLNTKYRVSVDVQFKEAERKIRISPPTSQGGCFVIGVWARVEDEYLYDNLWIKRYTLALCKKQIGQNLKKYKGLKLPGGEIDGDFYYNEGKEEIKDLEESVRKNEWGEPPTFYIG
jgi:hypothetical protein